MSDVATGLFEPSAAAAGDRLAAVLFRADGYHLGVGECCAPAGNARETCSGHMSIRLRMPASRRSSAIRARPAGTARGERSWPRYWLPTLDPGIRNGYLIGATTSGSDVIGRHTFTAHAAFRRTASAGSTGRSPISIPGLGLPILQFDASQDWISLGGISERDSPQTILGELFRRTWSGDVTATWLRQRYRTALSLSGGVASKQWSHFTKPKGLIPLIDTTGAVRHADISQPRRRRGLRELSAAAAQHLAGRRRAAQRHAQRSAARAEYCDAGRRA